MSLAAYMGTFKQLLDTCTGQRWTPSASAITASTALPGCWRGWPRVSPMAASPCRSNRRTSRRARATAKLPHMGYFVVFVPCLSIAGGAQKTGYLHGPPRCPFRKSLASVLSWERRAPARIQKPRWSVALPGKPLEHWRCIYATDI
jgi:hypothetical protein